MNIGEYSCNNPIIQYNNKTFIPVLSRHQFYPEYDPLAIVRIFKICIIIYTHILNKHNKTDVSLNIPTFLYVNKVIV
jgi:hypothetical protein